MANQWFRLYHEFATDPKIQMLSEANQRRFVMLLCLKCCNGDVTLHDDEVAFQLRISNEEWSETKQVLIKKNLINESNEPVAWDKRQFVSDSSAARVAKHRAAKKQQGKACNVTVTPPDTDTDTDTDTDKTYCQEKIPDAEIALENLNAVCWKKFRPTKTNLKNINARLKEKYTLEDLAIVAEHKSFTWAKDPRMREYLRPQTLYSEKFESYLQAANEWSQAGKPDYENYKQTNRETSFERTQRIAREYETRLLREIAELESEEAGGDHYASLAANG